MSEKIGRNDNCPCGSGKKYKKCCLDSDTAKHASPEITSQPSMEDFLTIYDVSRIFLKSNPLNHPELQSPYIQNLASSFNEKYFECTTNKNQIIVSYSPPSQQMETSFCINAKGQLMIQPSMASSPKPAHLLLFVLASEYLGFKATEHHKLTTARLALATKHKIKELLKSPIQLIAKLVPVASNLTWPAHSNFIKLGDLVSQDLIMEGQSRTQRFFEPSFCEIDTETYLFSDGTIISEERLLDHPYLLFANKLMQASPEESLSPWERVDSFDDDDDVFDSIVTPTDNKEKTHTPDHGIYLVCQKTKNLTADKLSHLKLMKISTVKKTTVDDVIVEIKYPLVNARLKSKLTQPSQSIKVSKSWSFDLNSQALIKNFTPLDQIFSSNRSHYEFFENVKTNNSADILSIRFKQSEDPTSEINQLQKTVLSELAALFGDTLVIQNLLTIPQEDIRAKINITSTNKESLIAWNLTSQNNTEPHHLFHSQYLRIFKLCMDGLAALFGHYELLAQLSYWSDRPVPRSNDNFLHHKGIGLYILQQLAQLSINGFDLENKDQAAERMFHQVCEIFIASEKSTKKISQLCSRQTLEAVKQKILQEVSTIQLNRPKLHILDGQIAAAGTQKFFWEFVMNFCLAVIGDKGPDIFAKQRLRSIPKGPNEYHLNYHQDGIKITILESKSCIGYFINDRTDLFVDGKSLEILNESDFSTSITINESQDKIDWFDLHPKTFFRGKEINMDTAAKFTKGTFVEYDGKIFIIPNKNIPKLKWLDYFWSRIHPGKNSASKASGDSKIFATRPCDVLNMLAMKRSGIPVHGGPRWQAIESAYEAITSRGPDQALSPDHLHKNLTVPLKDFQRQGTQWMLDHYHLEIGGILADDMGLGKTIQTIGLFQSLDLQQNLGHCLVVVPSSLVFNWQQEITRFASNLSHVSFDPKQKDTLKEKIQDINSNGIVIVSYGMLSEHIEFFCSTKWNVVIFDEAQNLKNIKSTRTASARSLNAKIKFALTGTPMENHYGEYYSLIDLVVPGALGDYQEFMQEFTTKSAESREDSALRIEYLRLKTKPLLLRRTKDKILSELPEKTETLLTLPFEPSQKKIYRDTALTWNNRIQELIAAQGVRKGQIQMLTALLRLRQACSHPGMLPNISYSKSAPKFEALIESLTELQERNEPAVVFTCFRTTLIKLQKELSERGVLTLVLDGQVPTKQRAKILEDFEKSSGHIVLLMTQKVGGVGLNLTKASYVFHLEPWWNPAVENQATDRVHRMGQTKSVQVYRYIMGHSVEEKIQLLKSRKSQLFADLMDDEDVDALGSRNSNSALSKEDFDYLLS